jgi:O-acetylhomoserine (thiol)-lyase
MGSADRSFGFRTRAVHAGGRPDPTTGARAVPIYQTTSFVFEDTADAADLFALQKYGNIYTRIANPTVAAFEERMASLEGGIGAVATASGMSAEFVVLAALCGSGDHVVSSAQLYGGTRTLLEATLARFGVETTFVASGDPKEFAAALRPETKAVYTEVIANPSGAIADLEGLAEVAGDAGVPSWSTRRLPPLTSAARWSGARTSSSILRRSSSAGTGRRSAAWSSSPAASTGRTATSR